MFHTLEMNCQLTKEKYDKLYKAFYEYDLKDGSKPYKMRKKNAIYLKGPGVTWFLINNISESSYFCYSIEARINPKALLEDDFISVASTGDLKFAIKVFDKLSREISKHMPKFDYYAMKRIDYCINIDASKIHPLLEAKHIIKLIKRSDKPSTLAEHEDYDDISKRYKPYKTSYYLENDSLHVNIYDKHEQLMAKIPEYDDIENARNIIRFEVQCLAPKLKEIRKKFDIKKDEPSKLLTEEVCSHIILSYYKKTIGYGNYYTLEEAIKMIENSNYSKGEKKSMVSSINLINTKRSVWKARESLETDYKIRKFNNDLERMLELDINPVTIPRTWGANRVKNMVHLVNKALGIEEK
jgi:hypothetical protein